MVSGCMTGLMKACVQHMLLQTSGKVFRIKERAAWLHIAAEVIISFWYAKGIPKHKGLHG